MNPLGPRALAHLLSASTALFLVMMNAASAQQTAPILLPETVVTASRVPIDAAKVGSAITVIDRQEIERRGVTFVSDLLRTVPGVAIARSGPVGSTTQARIRGAEANHALVLIDGIEVNDPANDSEFNFANLLTADVERIEVLRGPQSALWGADALAGVINIVTRRGSGGPRGIVTTEGGSFGTATGSASLLGGAPDYDYAATAAGFRTRGISTAPGPEHDGYENLTLSGKAGWRPLDGLDLAVVGRYVDAESQDDPGFPLPVDTYGETAYEQFYGRAQAKLATFGGAWEHVLGTAYTESKTLARDSFSRTRNVGDKKRLDYQTNVAFDTPEIAGATHAFSLLAEREEETFRTRGFTSVDRDVTNYGYAGEYRLGLFSRLFLSGALRYDDNDIFENETTYRLTTAYLHPETSTRLHGSYGTGVKNPSFFELFGTTNTFRGNPDLQPEYSRGFDVGVEQQFEDGRYVVDVTYFHQNLEDEIQGFGPTAFNLDGTSKRRGIEVTGKARLLPDLDLSASYTYLHTRDPDGDVEVRRPKHIASLNVNYRFLENRANVNVGLNYNGTTEDLDFRPVFPAPAGRIALDDYLLVNVTASYRVTDWLEAYGRVENLLDEDYENVFGFETPGIGVYAGLRATFGP